MEVLKKQEHVFLILDCLKVDTFLLLLQHRLTILSTLEESKGLPVVRAKAACFEWSLLHGSLQYLFLHCLNDVSDLQCRKRSKGEDASKSLTRSV